MAHKTLEQACVAVVEELNQDAAERFAYGALWNSANRQPGRPLPCPRCFATKGEVRPLQAIESNDPSVVRMRCANCASEFTGTDDAA